MAREVKPAKRERRSLPMFVLPSEIPALSGKKSAKRAGGPRSRKKLSAKKGKTQSRKRR